MFFCWQLGLNYVYLTIPLYLFTFLSPQPPTPPPPPHITNLRACFLLFMCVCVFAHCKWTDHQQLLTMVLVDGSKTAHKASQFLTFFSPGSNLSKECFQMKRNFLKERKLIFYCPSTKYLSHRTQKQFSCVTESAYLLQKKWM